MLELLQSQLDNERAILENLKATKRDDYTALYLLRRIGREIKNLEEKINEHKKVREKVLEHGDTRGLTRYAKKAMRAYWAYINSYRNAILKTLAKTTL